MPCGGRIVLEALPKRTLIAPGSLVVVRFSMNTARALVAPLAPPAEKRNRWPVTFVPLKELNRKLIVPLPEPSVPLYEPPPFTRLLLTTRASAAAVNEAALMVVKLPK